MLLIHCSLVLPAVRIKHVLAQIVLGRVLNSPQDKCHVVLILAASSISLPLSDFSSQSPSALDLQLKKNPPRSNS